MFENELERAGRGRWSAILIFALFVAIFSLNIQPQISSGNEGSRFAAIESRVERGTWVINESGFVDTPDKIEVNGTFVSDKPPFLAALGAVIYTPLHFLFGLNLYDGYASGTNWAVVVIAWVLSTLPAAGIVAVVYRRAVQAGWARWISAGLAASLGLGTGIWVYSGVLNNHVIAAFCLVLGLKWATEEIPSFWQLFGLGAVLTAATAIDLSAGLFALAIGLVFLSIHGGRGLFPALIGSLIPLFIASWLHWRVGGTLLPPQFIAAGYDYAGSGLYANIGGVRSPESIGLNLFHFLIGDAGLFAFFPITLWFLAGLIYGARSESGTPQQIGSVFIGIASILYLAYFVAFTDSFGGDSFGNRWLILPLPLWAFLLIPDQRSFEWPRPRWIGMLVALVPLLGLSLFTAWQGNQAPWQAEFPLIRLAIDPIEPDDAIDIAISGYNGVESIDPLLVEGIGDSEVVRRWFIATEALVIPKGEAWLFIGPQTPPAPEWGPLLGPSLDKPIGRTADLEQAARLWLTQFNRNVSLSSSTAAPYELTPIVLPVTFTDTDGLNQVALNGVQISQPIEGQLHLISGWEIVRRTQPVSSRRIFVHLLNDSGELVAQSDNLGVSYANLREGDIFFQKQVVSLAGLPPGRYTLQLGLYQPNNGVRLTLSESGDERIILTQVEIGE